MITVPDNSVYSNAFPNFNAFNESAFGHFQLSYSKSFVKDQRDINEVENFSKAKKDLLTKNP